MLVLVYRYVQNAVVLVANWKVNKSCSYPLCGLRRIPRVYRHPKEANLRLPLFHDTSGLALLRSERPYGGVEYPRVGPQTHRARSL